MANRFKKYFSLFLATVVGVQFGANIVQTVAGLGNLSGLAQIGANLIGGLFFIGLAYAVAKGTDLV